MIFWRLWDYIIIYASFNFQGKILRQAALRYLTAIVLGYYNWHKQQSTTLLNSSRPFLIQTMIFGSLQDSITSIHGSIFLENRSKGAEIYYCNGFDVWWVLGYWYDHVLDLISPFWWENYHYFTVTIKPKIPWDVTLSHLRFALRLLIPCLQSHLGEFDPVWPSSWNR